MGRGLHKFIEPLDMSATALAKRIDVPANRITDVNRGHRGVTADTALRLGEFFGTSPEFWMNLQTALDLSKVQAERATGCAVEVRAQMGTATDRSGIVAIEAGKIQPNPRAGPISMESIQPL